jgi:APA family basic amino acid/polyamine antiporter
MQNHYPESRLSRSLTLTDAVSVGLSSILGSGIFIIVTPAFVLSGKYIFAALLLAAFLAYANANSAAKMAALYPISGGTYVYARNRLNIFCGWLAGWTFIISKIASSAVAALTFGYYLSESHSKIFAIGAILVLTLVNYFGIHRTAMASRILVSIVVCILIAFTLSVFAQADFSVKFNMLSNSGTSPQNIISAAALIFFAFAGYGRITTMSEEVIDASKNIPKAIFTVLFLAFIIYLGVFVAVIFALDQELLLTSKTPLLQAAEHLNLTLIKPLIQIASSVATLGVLLALIAGISRIIFAMAANKELPLYFAAIHPKYKVPHHAEITVAVICIGLILWGDIFSSLEFSAFTILIYYFFTNASAFTLKKHELNFKAKTWLKTKLLSVFGAVSCLGLAFMLPPMGVIRGVLLIGIGTLIFFALKIIRK